MNTLSEDQKVQYGNFWTSADADQDGQIGQNDAISFFQKSGLANEVLGSIWGQVNPNNTPTLSPDQFVYACQLISMGQNGRAPNIAELQQIKSTGVAIPPPTFAGSTPQTFAQPTGTPGPSPTASVAGGLEPTAADFQLAQTHFAQLDTDRDGFVTGGEAVPFFVLSGLNQDTLAAVWALSDVDGDGRLDLKEFTCATFFVFQLAQGKLPALPTSLPPSVRAAIWKTGTGSVTSSTPGSSSGVYIITEQERATDAGIFQSSHQGGFIGGGKALEVLRMSGLDDATLGQIYGLADLDLDGQLSANEFLVAMKLIRARLAGHPPVSSVPQELITCIQGFSGGVSPNPHAGGNIPSQAIVSLLEQRIAELQAKQNSLEAEVLQLRVGSQNLKEERDKANLRAQDAESRLNQAAARVDALSGESQQQASAAMSQINQLSTQLNESFQKFAAGQAAYTELENKYNQQSQALAAAQASAAATQRDAAMAQARAAPAGGANPFGGFTSSFGTATPPTQQANPFGGFLRVLDQPVLRLLLDLLILL